MIKKSIPVVLKNSERTVSTSCFVYEFLESDIDRTLLFLPKPSLGIIVFRKKRQFLVKF